MSAEIQILDLQGLSDQVRNFSKKDFENWTRENITRKSVENIVRQVFGYGDQHRSIEETNVSLARILGSVYDYIRFDERPDVEIQNLFIEIAEGRQFVNYVKIKR